MKGWAWTAQLGSTPLARWLDALPAQVEQVWRDRPHGDLPGWRRMLNGLPHLSLSDVDLTSARVRAGCSEDCGEEIRFALREQLMLLHPWRKGPFEICGLNIDTEWRSDWKWARIAPHLQSLKDRLVLDVGCGNGYYGWRMLGEGARRVIGIDPTQLFVMQFEALRHFLGPDLPLHVLPLSLEDVPDNLQAFDTVFSMGVLYHRRSPFAHLAALKGTLRKGGELVLETLAIEGEAGQVLVPEGRYAKMRNVWFIPSPDTLASWLRRAGFTRVRRIDFTPTTTEEQRATEWMRFESLADYLDPTDPGYTVEGFPAPRRVTFIAEA